MPPWHIVRIGEDFPKWKQITQSQNSSGKLTLLATSWEQVGRSCNEKHHKRLFVCLGVSWFFLGGLRIIYISCSMDCFWRDRPRSWEYVANYECVQTDREFWTSDIEFLVLAFLLSEDIPMSLLHNWSMLGLFSTTGLLDRLLYRPLNSSPNSFKLSSLLENKTSRQVLSFGPFGPA